MFRLTLNFGGKNVQKFNFDKDVVVIGRDAEADVLIDNIGISRRHATIERSNDEYVLTDLKSHNGTFVRGQRIYHHQLSNTDEFFVGKYSMQFENLSVTAEPAPPPEPQQLSAGMQDMTFRLDKTEIERLMGQSSLSSTPRFEQTAPEAEKGTLLLEGYCYLMGKHKRAAIKLPGFLAPQFAAVLVKEDNWFRIVTLNHRTVVMVNGNEVEDHQLSDGDTIQIGKRKFRYRLS